MKKKDLQPIRKQKFGKLFRAFFKKNKKMSKILFFRSVFSSKFNKRLYYKYTVVNKFVKFFKDLVFKKEFFCFRNFFFKLNLKNEVNFFLTPHFTFEKQFLFKFIDYQNLALNSFNNSIFFKKKYNFIKNTGLNYLITANTVVADLDPKDPIFYLKDVLQFDNVFDNSFLNFTHSLNYNIFFFMLVDIYKIIIYCYLQKLLIN